jgi:hypothetical protein
MVLLVVKFLLVVKAALQNLLGEETIGRSGSGWGIVGRQKGNSRQLLFFVHRLVPMMVVRERDKMVLDNILYIVSY